MAQPLDNLTRTWTSGATESGIKLSVTDPGAAAASNLLELRGGAAGTTSLFSVTKAGDATAGNVYFSTKSTNTVPGFQFAANGGYRVGMYASQYAVEFGISDTAAGGITATFGALKYSVNAKQLTLGAGSTAATSLIVDDAHKLAQSNGDNGQTFRVYGRGGGTANFERAFIDAPTTAGTAVKIGTEKGGTATARALELQTDGTTRVNVEATGAINVTSATLRINKTDAATSDTSLQLAGDFGNNAQFLLARNGTGSGFPAHSLNLQLNGATDGFIIRDGGTFRWAFNRAGLLQAGGTTSSFPALKRDAAKIQVVDAAGNFTGTSGLVTQNLNFQGVTVANLPAAPVAGDVAYVTDGGAALAWGDTVTGSGSTKYLVWYNGTNWTVAGK